MSHEAMVLLHRGDVAGTWAYERLRARNLPVRLVVVDAVFTAHRWIQRLDGSGSRSRIEVHGLPPIDSDRIRGVLNRCVSLPDGAIAGFAPEERAHVANEWHAVLVSWLASLRGPVLNPVAPDGLCGRPRTDLAWRVLARSAGLAAGPTAVSLAGAEVPPPSGRRRLVVVGDRVLGRSNASTAAACVRLAQLAGVELLEVSLTAEGAFATADPMPDLRRGREAIVDAIAHRLELSA